MSCCCIKATQSCKNCIPSPLRCKLPGSHKPAYCEEVGSSCREWTMQYDAIMFALITTPTGNTFELQMYSTSLGGGGGVPMNQALQLWVGSFVCGSGGVCKVTEADSPQHREPSISLITVYAIVSNHIMINRRPPLLLQINCVGATSESVWIREQRCTVNCG